MIVVVYILVWEKKRKNRYATIDFGTTLSWFIVGVIYLLQNLLIFVANFKILFKNVWFYCAWFDTF